MRAWLAISCLWWSTGASLDTGLIQVAPDRKAASWARSPGHDRAVVLIHGLYIHPFSKTNVARAALHGWQMSDSLVVRRLGKESDVYAFAYAQTVAVDAVPERAGLLQYVQALQRRGYREIVLVGHSAGGLIAREFVEDHPDSPVTKVIQVSAPNGGSSWAKLQTVRANQVDFLDSLSKPLRRKVLAERADRTIPAHVEFACVVGTGTINGDGLVLADAQWTPDLQRQGIPVYPLNCTHWFTVRTQRAADLIATLVRTPQPRWPASRVEAYRRHLLGN
jgi:pimeloyl-ACP methyl ester carboxylesterase